MVAVVVLLAATQSQAASPPRVVVGHDGYLFISQDWRVTCQDTGNAGRVAGAVRDLVTALERSGRRALVVVGPDKSTVQHRQVPRAGVPDRACGDSARAAVWRALSGTPGHVDLRAPLARAAEGTRPPYWRKDTHWTPTGGAVYARALAQRLDPELARRLVLQPGTYSRRGDLARDLGRPDAETVPGVQLVNPGAVVVDQGYWEIGTLQPALVSSAVGAQSGTVVPGRTVIVGDSYTGTAHDSLAPLFQELVFFHPGYSRGDDVRPIVRQLEQADTVVIQVVERFAQRYRMFERDVVEAVRELPHRRTTTTVPYQPVGVPYPGALPPSVSRLLGSSS